MGAITADARAVARTRPWRKYAALAGPGALVAVGYIDPGNWATDLAGGSRYAYALLSVVVVCSLVAILFQTMSARLGLATGKDLAVLTREAYPRAAWALWAAAELAVIATDLAEVLGSALALKLLFHMPLVLGVAVTAFDVGLLLLLERRGARALYGLVTALVVVVGAGLAYELVLARPDGWGMMRGLIPTTQLLRDPEMLLVAVGILGATVMPHNLYLHSSLVLPQATGDVRARLGAARRATIDTVVSLGAAMFLNGALVVLAAAVFHGGGHDVASIEDAHELLAPSLGAAAPIVFAIALLAAGQSATITGTLAGQIVMSGFLEIRLPAWQRRLITRACAIVPTLIVIGLTGESSTNRLLVVSQVILSLELPFAMVPLMIMSSDATRMGALVTVRWMRALGWVSVVAIIFANVGLVAATIAR